MFAEISVCFQPKKETILSPVQTKLVVLTLDGDQANVAFRFCNDDISVVATWQKDDSVRFDVLDRTEGDTVLFRVGRYFYFAFC